MLSRIFNPKNSAEFSALFFCGVVVVDSMMKMEYNESNDILSKKRGMMKDVRNV